ncbi:hypothetical protein BGX20_005796, partial [Mortierella sp. AD010]
TDMTDVLDDPEEESEVGTILDHLGEDESQSRIPSSVERPRDLANNLGIETLSLDLGSP